MPRLLISCALGLVIAAHGLPGAAQCAVDTDCPGDAVCESGRCASPPSPAATGSVAPAPAAEFDPFAVGVYGSLGMAHGFVTYTASTRENERPTPTPRFAGGGGAYLDFYVSKNLGFELGLGAVGKGYRVRYDYVIWGEEYKYDRWQRVITLEIPLGVKLRARWFRAAIAIAPSVDLSGETKTKLGEEDAEVKTWGDEAWEERYHRFNLCPRLALGAAIRLGAIAVVASIAASMEILNDSKEDKAYPGLSETRYLNVMLDLGLELGFGG